MAFQNSAIDNVIDDPLNYLWNKEQIFPQNKENYELLLRSFNKTEFVSFIGAGVSKPLGISDWDNLIDDLCKVANELGFKDTIPTDKNKYPDFAEKLFDFLREKNRQPLYFDTITKRMTPHFNSTSLTLVYMTLSLDVHLTTNFDRSIEYAYHFIVDFSKFSSSSNKYEKPSLYYLSDLNTASNGPRIYYLHGSVNEKTYILKKSDYDMFYPSVSKQKISAVKKLEDCLKNFYKYKNIIFIGFSFEDPYVKKFFFDLAKEVEREHRATSSFYSQSGQSCSHREIKHFLLIEEGNKFIEEYNNEFFSKLKNYNLYPVVYQKNKHIFLECLFKKLIQ